jgi:hypothetical protein
MAVRTLEAMSTKRLTMRLTAIAADILALLRGELVGLVWTEDAASGGRVLAFHAAVFADVLHGYVRVLDSFVTDGINVPENATRDGGLCLSTKPLLSHR